MATMSAGASPQWGPCGTCGTCGATVSTASTASTASNACEAGSRLRTLAWLSGEHGRNVSSSRVASRKECLAPNSGCSRRSSPVHRSGNTRDSGDDDTSIVLSVSAQLQTRIRGAATFQTRITSPLSDHRIASTSLEVAASMSLLLSAPIASSTTATNSCSLMFMPRCVLSMSRPV